ncbi:MAG TPA: hypothetical protein DCG57_08375, partial [Candidatus Riflebacteria bacterium]|nr:hypothetical protein [Candidatus Riflebacteria bacterium]
MNKQLFTALLLLALPTGLAAQLAQRNSLPPVLSGGTQNQQNRNATLPAANDPTLPLLDSARTFMVENKFSQAREALRTALRLAPMSLEIWAMYDEAVSADYVDKMRKEKYNPVIERDIEPIFSINRVDSYIELGTLYVVGTLQNISKDKRQKIVLTARMLDENKRELRRETGTLLIPERGL